MSKQKQKTRLIVTLSEGLRKALNKSSENRGCSLAETVRTALYEHLKSYINEQEKKLVKNWSPLRNHFEGGGN